MTTTELSPRELQVLLRISYGLTNGEIGEQLGIDEDTVKTHVRRLMQKLDVTARAGAVRAGFEAGVLKVGDQDPTRLPVVVDWQRMEQQRQVVMPARPVGDRHIAACFAAESCPCRVTSTWRFPEPPAVAS